jgi:hypothetical protein
VKYRYSCQSANEAGEHRHPQKVILEIAPGAHNFEPESVADCWFFESVASFDLPAFITAMPEATPARPLTPQEHQVWLTVYNTVLVAKLAEPPQMTLALRVGEEPQNPAEFAANRALEAYRKACAQ